MEKIAVGVIGAGNMGANHIRVYNELTSDVKLIGFYDANKERASEIKKKYNIIAFESIESLLNNVQAVSIASPTSLHYEHGVLCADKNIHVLMEKPIAANYDEGTKINKIFNDKNIILQVGHIERFNPAAVELKNIIKNFAIWSISFNRLSIVRRIQDASIVHDLMIHDIDLLNWLVDDKIKNVHAEGIINALGNNSVDFAEALIKFENGIVANLTASRITEDKIRTINVHTVDSFIHVDLITRNININKKTAANANLASGITYQQESIVEKIFVPQYEPLRAQIMSFLNAIKNNEKPVVSGEIALDALYWADTIQNKIIG